MSGYVARVRAAWAALTGEQRLAAIAALGLIVSMFLPWYTTSADDHSYSAFGVWSFVEASILLVAIGVLGLLFARGERRAFHLPGGDGLVLMAAGGWCMFLDFYRQLDKPNIDASRGTVGVSWGIFVAFLFGALLAWAGWRMVRSHASEPVATATTRARHASRATARPSRHRRTRATPGPSASARRPRRASRRPGRRSRRRRAPAAAGAAPARGGPTASSRASSASTREDSPSEARRLSVLSRAAAATAPTPCRR